MGISLKSLAFPRTPGILGSPGLLWDPGFIQGRWVCPGSPGAPCVTMFAPRTSEGGYASRLGICKVLVPARGFRIKFHCSSPGSQFNPGPSNARTPGSPGFLEHPSPRHTPRLRIGWGSRHTFRGLRYAWVPDIGCRLWGGILYRQIAFCSGHRD